MRTLRVYTAAPGRARWRGSRCRRLLPRVPLHGRVLPPQGGRVAHPRGGPHDARRRRGRRPAAQARARLHAGREVWRARAAHPGQLQDPLRQLDGQGRDRLRPLRLRLHQQGRHHHPRPRRQLLGHPLPHPALRGRGGVPLSVLGIPPVRIRRAHPCPRREAQERAQRQASPFIVQRQRPQARASQPDLEHVVKGASAQLLRGRTSAVLRGGGGGSYFMSAVFLRRLLISILPSCFSFFFYLFLLFFFASFFSPKRRPWFPLLSVDLQTTLEK
ncbi:hypothetical protein CTA2_2319 [Colletotrichum tanaceti]|uniref:Uncharacterized protein n=1 Tax=Colletotrichum tanaceti TaxID=1306861 RepID=A0A4U6X070_9PEZI|nr:hypothetical protein CTA2_2319 [Colletotrichum tanaceti]TKW48772.1 hypothetical protein CTA1_10110 [Colletotrichum tanaceti]